MGSGRSLFVVLAAALGGGCASQGTTVTVLVSSDSVQTLRSVDVAVHAVGSNGFDSTAGGPLGGGGLRLPGRVVVEVPPEAATLTVTVHGIDVQGIDLTARSEEHTSELQSR